MLHRAWFLLADDGGVVVRLGDTEREVLGRLVGELRGALLAGASGSDPSEQLRRLFPTAHPDDPEAEAGYRELVGDQLLRDRLEALDTVEAGLGAGRLAVDEAETWMRVLNDLRLVLGTIVDVGENEALDIDPEDPLAGERVAYVVLTEWLGDLVEVLASR